MMGFSYVATIILTWVSLAFARASDGHNQQGLAPKELIQYILLVVALGTLTWALWAGLLALIF